MNKYQGGIRFVTGPIFMLIVLVMVGILGIVGIEKLQSQDEEVIVTTPSEKHISDGLLKGLGLIGAGVAFGLAALGAGIGIGNASSAAIGALSEKPSMFGISLVFVALCEGLVIFGFVIAAMIMGRI